jgi:ABC-type uncharacterized transport system YnjBCD permease subunit
MVAIVSSVLHVLNSCRMCSSQSCASLVCSADSSLITFLAPRSDPAIAVIVPQPWLPDDRDRSFRTASAALTLDVATV